MIPLFTMGKKTYTLSEYMEDYLNRQLTVSTPVDDDDNKSRRKILTQEKNYVRSDAAMKFLNSIDSNAKNTSQIWSMWYQDKVPKV